MNVIQIYEGGEGSSFIDSIISKSISLSGKTVFNYSV